jgi:hypothetical protein
VLVRPAPFRYIQRRDVLLRVVTTEADVATADN